MGCARKDFADEFNGAFQAVQRGRRELLTEPEVRCRDGKPPRLRDMPENVTGEGKHRAWVGGVGHELGGISRFKRTPLDFFRPIHRSIHKDDGFGAGNRVGMFG